jgi:hypothetical protein
MSRLPTLPISSLFAALALGAAFAPAQAPSCKPGYVFREIFPGDNVCVTPETRAQAMADNRDAVAHRAAPNKETCIQGYVWREAGPQDRVCVPPATRNQTQADNRSAVTRIMATGAAPVMIAAAAPAFRAEPPAQQVVPGFRISSTPPPPRAPQVRIHPRPYPLTGDQINSAVAKFGLHVISLHLPVPPDITYQLEVFDTSTGGEVNTNSLQSTVFYTSGPGSMGYIQIDFNVNPGIQNVLDCSLGADGTYKVVTSMTGVPNAEGTISSFNQHLMIPFSTTPSNAKSAQAIIYFGNIEFDGCALETVSH